MVIHGLLFGFLLSVLFLLMLVFLRKLVVFGVRLVFNLVCIIYNMCFPLARSPPFFKEVFFMNRYPVNSGADKAYFSRTASKTKSINLATKIFRGGIRL